MHVLLKVLDAKMDTLTTGSGDQGPKSAAASRQAAGPAVGIAACLILTEPGGAGPLPAAPMLAWH
jgi:hypothetical protein